VAEELGDDDEVGAAAHEGGREGMAQDVDGRVVVEAGGRGDRGDDVVGAPDAEALAALVEEQGGTVVGAGPVGVDCLTGRNRRTALVEAHAACVDRSGRSWPAGRSVSKV
jgi:hypothetical protein